MKPLRFLTLSYFSTFLLVSLITATFLSATTLLPLTQKELTHASDLVVVATASSIPQSLSKDDAPRFSFFILQVEETLKGVPAASITLKLIGGPAGSSKRVEGQPSFLPKTRSVFFLNLRPEEAGKFYNVTGWSQGKLDVKDDFSLAGGGNLDELRKRVSDWKSHPEANRLKRRARPLASQGPAPSHEARSRVLSSTPHAPKREAVHTNRALPRVTPSLSDAEKEKRDRAQGGHSR
jgi:hypothetical protein